MRMKVAHEGAGSSRIRPVVENIRRTFGRGVISEWAAFMLTSRARAILQFSPEHFAEALGLDPTMIVAEVGCGPGYLSGAVARRLPRGRLVLLDLQVGMLVRARHRIGSWFGSTVDYVACDVCAIPLESACCHLAYLVTVLGEVHDASSTLQEVRRILRPDGLLVVSEHWSDPDFVSSSELCDLAAVAGFAIVRFSGRPRNYIAHFGVSDRAGEPGSDASTPHGRVRRGPDDW